MSTVRKIHWRHILVDALCVVPLAASVIANAQEPARALPPVAVTANPLGSELHDMIPPVSVLGGQALMLRMQPTLGEIVGTLVGVSSSYYGPNASRPVIRGFDGDRIRVLQNGVGLIDASATSVDHAVALDTLTTRRVEVVRGPGTLLYGPNALGGVVNVIDGRIPTEAPAGLSGGAEIRHASAPGERSASGAVDLALDNGLALHVDGFRRKTSDLRIPGYARSARLREIDPLPPGDEEARSRLTNSASDSDGAAVGVAWTGPRGGLGASVARYATDYGTVAEEDVTIRMKQTRTDVAADWLSPFGALRSIKARFGHSDYEHTEYEGDEAGTVFRSRGYELRVDAAHARIGPFEGAFGVQALDFDFSALGAEGFLPRTATKGFAAFLYEEARFDRWKLGLGLRYDRVRVSADDDERFGPGLVRTFNAGSASIGGTYEVGKHTAIVASVVASRRPPTYQELYADGPHVATGLIEIGDRSLGLEKAVGVDLAARRKAGPLTGSVGVYWNRFRNYITLFPTGEIDPDEGLPVYAYRGTRATFVGIEAEGKLSVGRLGAGDLELEMRADGLRAKDDDSGRPLPRIAPWRLGGALVWSADRWSARLDVLRVQRQNRVAEDELPTDGYTMVDLSLVWRLDAGRGGLVAFIRGTNLLDEEARNHVSFLKDVAPLGERGVTVGLRGSF